jgi:ATP-dependent helicase/nuclease subunit A
LLKNIEGDEDISFDEVITDEQLSEIKERLDFTYPHAHLNKLPAKLSVSKLTPTVLDDVDDAATLESFDEAKILEIEEFFESKSKITSADKGTATHLFLQFCNFENAEKNGAKAELSRLVDKKFIAPQVAELINLKQIEKFFESDFYSTLKNAKKTYREQRFNILLPASHFTQDEEFKSEIEKEEILVQGVIDLFFEDENGRIILCDYKTDYLTPEELKDEALVIQKMKNRHGKQLEYYAMAIERFLGKAPDSILIYSLPYGEAVEIPI